MDFVFGHYLIKYMNLDIEHKIDDTNQLAVVIIATKPSFWLPLIIKNTLDKISKCNLYFFGSTQSIALVQNQLNINTIRYKTIDDFNDIKSYNQYLLSNHFWNTFPEKYVLITQPDCIILRDIEESDFHFDYIGASCGSFNENFIINGGLSLRNKEVMVKICDGLSSVEKKGNIAEDIVFTKKIKANFKAPTIDDCMNFSIESFGNLNKVLGIHGTDKYYIHPQIKQEFMTKYL